MFFELLLLNGDKDCPTPILLFFTTQPPNFHGAQSLCHWNCFFLFLHESKIFSHHYLFILGYLHICQHKLLARFRETYLHKWNSLSLLKETHNSLKLWLILNVIFLLSKQQFIGFPSSLWFFLASKHTHSPVLVVRILFGSLPFSCIYTQFEIWYIIFKDKVMRI